MTDREREAVERLTTWADDIDGTRTASDIRTVLAALDREAQQKKQAKTRHFYVAHLFGFYMPWTRGWKFGFRTVREGNAYFRGFKDGRRRERERLLSDAP